MGESHQLHCPSGNIPKAGTKARNGDWQGTSKCRNGSCSDTGRAVATGNSQKVYAIGAGGPFWRSSLPDRIFRRVIVNIISRPEIYLIGFYASLFESLRQAHTSSMKNKSAPKPAS